MLDCYSRFIFNRFHHVQKIQLGKLGLEIIWQIMKMLTMYLVKFHPP